MRSWCWWVDYC